MKAQGKTVGKVAVGKEAQAFKRAAQAYVERSTTSSQTANKALVALGIYDARGKLTKNYRP